ncbi:MAG: cytochrome C [Hyphomicrobium sp.]|uniref:c-type cytochrome n=1 Tax=Hyphomicrobium sp. TaxID=82 RepID=UPI0039E5D035
MRGLIGKLARTAAFALMICGAPLHASSQEIGDPRHGYVFASAHCTECHAIDPNNLNSPNPKAPSFTSVAKSSGMTGRALAVWLDSTHPTMPNFVLRTSDRDDVVAYIMSLKDVPAPK